MAPIHTGIYAVSFHRHLRFATKWVRYPNGSSRHVGLPLLAVLGAHVKLKDGDDLDSEEDDKREDNAEAKVPRARYEGSRTST